MRFKFCFIFSLALAILITFSCKKDTINEPPAAPTPAPSGINTVDDIINANGAVEYTVSVSATSASTITYNSIIFEIPANAFLTSTGGTVGGIVTLNLKTILNKSQVIFSGVAANSSNSKLISTKACVKATASQNTQSLRLNTGGNFFVNVPDASPSPPLLKKYYTLEETAIDSTQYWALGTDVSNIPQVTYTATVYHHASLDSLKWLNVGFQYDSIGAPKTAVSVSLTASMFSKNNTMVFLSFNGSLTVGAMFEISPGIFRISNMPQGKGVHIIGVSVINGQYYSAVLSTLVPAPGSLPIPLNMQPVSQTQMQSQIAALP
ncbi:MAG TPA: hypothetical protein VN026_10795 [Bacteroidia bacterium]|jgi:hypothetical protein|nr:hypothetical protein [Bacteroidia bacterium]